MQREELLNFGLINQNLFNHILLLKKKKGKRTVRGVIIPLKMMSKDV